MTGHVFHPGHDELHGITVVVETVEGDTFLGRFDRRDEHGAHLKDVGVHKAGVGGAGEWDEYLQHALKYGIRVEHAQVLVPEGSIKRIQKLTEVAPAGN